MRGRLSFTLFAGIGLLAAAPVMASVTTFDGGNTNGWGVFGGNDGTLGDFIEPTGGNPTFHDHFIMVDTFGARFHNNTHADVIGNYSRFTNGVTLGIDVNVQSITHFGNEVSRNLIVELIDENPPGSDYPYVSVWFNLGEISAAQPGWRSFSTTISNVESATLPAGWGGYGAEDPNTSEPILPADRTFASVLDSVDEIRFTTFEPGWFYGFTNFDVRYDNAGVVAVPEPSTLGALAGIASLAMRRRRRN